MELTEAINRLRTYVPPPTAYGDVPLSRRAAVLILLYADPNGELRVVITIRAKTLSSYAGEAALPGGKADTLDETPFQTARREAWEEIGLSDIDQPLPAPFTVEHLCELPANLAKTELVVRPCVALLHSFDEATGANADPEISLIPKLDAREVAAVFTARFEDFLRLNIEHDDDKHKHRGQGVDKDKHADPGQWYRGSWSLWHHSNWRMHHFFVPVNERVVKPRGGGQSPSQQRAVEELEAQEQSGLVQRYRVFGMTARIIVDAARVAYGREPEFEHNSHFGDEAMIAQLRRMGRLSARRQPSDELTREMMERAAKLS
ncbi:hypothetical protein N7509_004711 [Penicillium cosmopolitanum]|uniref:Nudix hydrolase domain-containing protein n=1 Tax=Penicillium cosmopolitanum TaxID=1131564 RepID=A0A9W9W123_9EURO|nr:uncharacterized protein N7509_004711 [Penicillium cosmopolitanum]KAJ5396598.1 hypothetical protein N7509_004711 [Penicillium cosmopolitanum]